MPAYKPHSQISCTLSLEAQDLEKKCGQKFIAESFHLMNILAEVKSFSLLIDDSICSLKHAF